MKKYFILYSLLLAVLPSISQEVLHLQNGSTITIQNGVEIVLQGGIGFDDGSSLVNDGILRLKNNVVANNSDWIDNNISVGPVSGTGTVIFNSDYIHHLTGLAGFYNLQMDAGGLILNSNIGVFNLLHLIAGKITTGSNNVFLDNNAAAALLNDASNTGYANSWINGKFYRQITSNTDVYDFPVGNDTRSNLLQFINNNITGTGGLTVLFGEKSGTDEGLNVSENGIPYISVNDGGIWNLWPNTDATGGNFGLKLYFNGFAGLSDNLFATLNRTLYSFNAADWQVPAGSALSPTDGAGRKVSDGYTLRTGIPVFGQFGIGILNACPDADNDGYTTCAGDCDDANLNVNPGATEICNAVDDDCDAGTIENCPAIPTVTINSIIVNEAAGIANLTVSLSPVASLPVKVNYKTIDGTAQSKMKNKDFKAVGNGSITIPAGAGSALIPISIVADNISEADEQFSVQLTKAGGAQLGTPSTAVVTITESSVNSLASRLQPVDYAKPDDTVNELQVQVYPNPTTNNFSITVQADTKEKIIMMQVVDMVGRIIETRNVNANSIVRFGDHYRPGIYFVRIIQGKQHKELKLVKLSD